MDHLTINFGDRTCQKAQTMKVVVMVMIIYLPILVLPFRCTWLKPTV